MLSKLILNLFFEESDIRVRNIERIERFKSPEIARTITFSESIFVQLRTPLDSSGDGKVARFLTNAFPLKNVHNQFTTFDAL